MPVSQVCDRDVLRNREHHRLWYWGLLEPHRHQGRTAVENSKDVWRITDKGKTFVEGKITVPVRAYIGEKRCFGFSEEHFTIQEALGKNFDYQELMGS